LLDVSLVCSGGTPPIAPTTAPGLALAQQRFSVDAAVGNGARTVPPSSAQERWQIPFCAKTDGAAPATCDVLADTRQTISLGALGRLGSSCPLWVFANAGARGYYRTAYPPEMLRAIAPGMEASLTAPERLSLMADEWALVRAGRHNVDDYLTLVTGLGRERTAGVLDEVVERLAFIHEYLTTPAAAPRLEAFTRTLFAPLAGEIGLSPAPGDSDARQELRAVAVDALGTIANDPDVVGRAAAALDKALEGATSLDATLAGPLVRVAAARGDARLYERLNAAASRAGSPDERYRYFNAAADFRDPAVIGRALQRVLSDEVRNQDASLYFQRFFHNPTARPLAWAFLKEHWIELEPKITIFGGDVGIARALGSFCDAATRDDVKAFFAAHPMRSAARAMDLTMERINNCIDLKTAQTAVVSAWLDRQPGRQ
jgi:aminopeptidase N/puromycin-sensitive aminopeptidase